MDARYLLNRVLAKLESALPDRELKTIADRFRDREALEIGGPSSLLAARGRLPVYPRLAALDCADYAQTTLWSGRGLRGTGSTPRRRFVSEAVSLGVPDCTYDAVIASHVIEHLADPIGALREWRRVTKPGGALLLIVPHRDGSFDHRRPVTTIEHLLADAERATSENDLTHLDEVLRLHDRRRDPRAGSAREFEQRCRENARYRALHHHVFTPSTVTGLCRVATLDLERLITRRPFHIICLARRQHDRDR